MRKTTIHHWRRTISAFVLVLATAATGEAQTHEALAILEGPDGQEAGVASLTETPEGVLVELRLDSAPPGAHAFHIHETGACSPDFSAAGGHYAPEDDSHGILHGSDDHAGDLLNIHVPDSEEGIVVERLAFDVTLEPGAPRSLLDGDGSAIVIHEGPDDYASQPSGAAGPRIICGVIET